MTTITETRNKPDVENHWQSKVDARGQTHVFRRITAGELQVGDHLLEHVTGHKRQVATPVLGIQHVPDGVVVTIPDRHANNAPVDELYPANAQVFISKTPHLERYNADHDFFVKKETAMEQEQQQVVDKASRGMDAALVNIDKSVEELLKTADPETAARASEGVHANAVNLSKLVILGSDAVAEAQRKDAYDFARWNQTLTASADFTRARSERLNGYAQVVMNQDIRDAAAYARESLDTATAVALEQRRRCVLLSLDGPLAEYALEDARTLGLVDQPLPNERGTVVAKIPPEALLTREDGALVALPMLTPDLRRVDVGEPVHLVANETGVYSRAPEQAVEVKQDDKRMEAMEQQTDLENHGSRKPEYPRMESHLKDQEGTWHSVSLYVDRENHPRGMISIENKARGLVEKYPIEFSERVSQKTGERFLTAKVDRAANNKPLHVNIVPVGKDADRGLKASFAERDPSLPKSQQFTPIDGKGGELRPNAALLERADKDRTAAYMREKLNVDPVQVHERSKGKGLGGS